MALPTPSSVAQPGSGINLVTGASGLVGSHLIAHLLAGSKTVKALYRLEIPDIKGKEMVTWIKGDILDMFDLQEAMVGVQYVYHCAAIVSFDPHDREKLFKTNVDGTANVVNACLDGGISKLCIISSVAALGRPKKNQAVNETMPWSEETNRSIYGKSKYLAEQEVWRGIAEGLQAVIVNPAIILGAADWNKGSTGMFKSAYDESPWYTEGSGGFVDVLDVVVAMVQLMESPVQAQRFIISADNWTFQKVFTEIAKNFGKRPPHKQVTPLLAAIIWRVEAFKSLITGKKPLITKETAATAQAHIVYDNAKLKQALPHFQYTDLNTTIARVCSQLQAGL